MGCMILLGSLGALEFCGERAVACLFLQYRWWQAFIGRSDSSHSSVIVAQNSSSKSITLCLRRDDVIMAFCSTCILDVKRWRAILGDPEP